LTVPEIDPGAHDISELGPMLNDIEDADQLRAILETERSDRDRDPVVTLLESRIDAVSGEDDGEPDDTEIDPGERSPAELANLVREVEDPERLEALLAAEESGQDRSSVRTVIENRLESVRGGEREEQVVETPEQRHPELDHPTADKRHVRALDGGVYRDMWVYCETQHGELIEVSREMLGKARELMDGYNDRYDADERVVAVLIGDGVGELAGECIALGADVVVHRDDQRLERFRHTPYTELFCDMARGAGHPHGREDRPEESWRDYDEPRYTLFPATNNGRDLSATVQAELDSGLASDCSDLYIEAAEISNPAKTGDPGTTRTFERVLHMKRPDFSGFEYSTILCLDTPAREFHPQGASVIPGSFPVPEPDPDREGLVVEHEAPVRDDWLHVEVTGHDRLEGGVDLSGHDVVVAMGRGIGRDPSRGIELGLELVDAFEDAALGLSRGVITASYEFDGHVDGYVAEERQIGESGQVVAPDLYVACGISGAVQHKVGMDESDTVVAINTDPGADIREFSDYFVEGDLFEVVPALVDSLENGELRLGTAVAADGGDRS
jgi:electron transfer flavoprotein alpha subunit